MTRADIIQIIFGIDYDKIDIFLKELRNICNNNKYDDCVDCELDESNCPVCPVFWTDQLVGEEWEDCVQRFTILYNTYRLGHNRGYLKGEERQRELESEELYGYTKSD